MAIAPRDREYEREVVAKLKKVFGSNSVKSEMVDYDNDIMISVILNENIYALTIYNACYPSIFSLMRNVLSSDDSIYILGRWIKTVQDLQEKD